MKKAAGSALSAHSFSSASISPDRLRSSRSSAASSSSRTAAAAIVSAA